MRCALAHASFAWPLSCWRANLTWRIRMFSWRICKNSRKPDQGRKRRGDHKIRFQYWNVSIPVISLFLSKISNQVLLPSPLSSLCVLNSDCHQYLTRQKDNLQLTFSLRVQGPQIWNDIPLSLRNSLFLVTNINWETIFNHYKFKLSWTPIFFFSLQTLFFITFCTLSLIVMFILLYMQ